MDERKTAKGVGALAAGGWDGEPAKVRVHARAAGEVNNHFHF